MSAAEIIEKLPSLTLEERREVQQRLQQLLDQPNESKRPPTGLRLARENGRVVLRADRIITQAEIEDILADFP